MIMFDFNWILYGVITGSFWGIFAVFFYVPYPLKWIKCSDTIRSIFIVLFQFLFNFLGGFVGWFCMRLFLFRYSQGHFNFPDLILFCISVLGISGKLSDILFKLPGALEQKVKQYLGTNTP